jgi:acetylornithine deacetylase/succinyl-diaminopimelate desuccinylase-like protein
VERSPPLGNPSWETDMPDEKTAETESTALLRTLIRNACVNDGTAASGQETRSVDALEDYFAGSGLPCERYESAPGRRSLITRVEGRDRTAPTLLLMGHLDVVPVNPAGWQRDPFGAELVDGIVWGRGATDMLNITSTMAVATRRLARSGFRPRGTLVYLAVADEEAGGTLGAGYLADQHPEAVRTDYVITESGGVPIPTPSGPRLPVTVGEKGGNARRLVVRGTPGHGSMPFRTDNALVTAARLVDRIANYQPRARVSPHWRHYVEALQLDPDVTAGLLDPDRVLDTARHLEPVGWARFAHACTHTTFSPNVARAGSKVNVVPDRVEVDVDIRALPGVTPDEVDQMLAEALGDLAPQIEIQRLRAEMGSLSGIDTPLGDALARVAQALVPGSRIVPRVSTGGTDAKFFRWRGVPAYGFALHSTRIPYTEYPLMFHGHNERVDTESLRLSTLMWEALCRDFLS